MWKLSFYVQSYESVRPMETHYFLFLTIYIVYYYLHILSSLYVGSCTYYCNNSKVAQIPTTLNSKFTEYSENFRHFCPKEKP